MSIANSPPTHRPPRQQRSRDSLNRVLTAAESLLETRLLEDITLAEILKKAHVSVGAFYARFSNKDAMIPFLYERYDRNLANGAARVLDRGRWRGLDLPKRVELLYRYVVRAYRLNRGLMRALTLYARARPEEITSAQRGSRFGQYEAAAALLLECRDEMGSRDPERDVRFALFVAGATFRDKILHGRAPHPGSVVVADRQLAIEMARVFLCYVGCRRRTT